MKYTDDRKSVENVISELGLSEDAKRYATFFVTEDGAEDVGRKSQGRLGGGVYIAGKLAGDDVTAKDVAEVVDVSKGTVHRLGTELSKTDFGSWMWEDALSDRVDEVRSELGVTPFIGQEVEKIIGSIDSKEMKLEIETLLAVSFYIALEESDQSRFQKEIAEAVGVSSSVIREKRDRVAREL